MHIHVGDHGGGEATDAQDTRLAPGCTEEGLADGKPWRRVGVVGEGSCHHVEQGGGVADGARDRATHRELPDRVAQRTVGDATSRGLDPHQSADACRDADGPTTVGAVRGCCEAGGHRGGRTAAGASR